MNESVKLAYSGTVFNRSLIILNIAKNDYEDIYSILTMRFVFCKFNKMEKTLSLLFTLKFHIKQLLNENFSQSSNAQYTFINHLD